MEFGDVNSRLVRYMKIFAEIIQLKKKRKVTQVLELDTNQINISLILIIYSCKEKNTLCLMVHL